MLAYTALFALLMGIWAAIFALNGQSFIQYGDTLKQHYPFLVYYGRWLRQAARCVLTGAAVPTWDFSIGYGADIITTLSYYGLGDPLDLLAAFVPGRWTEQLLEGLIVLRLYLAGLVFMAFSRRHGNSRFGTLLGALAYFVLTLVVNRRTPATPDTHYTADNGIVLNYESAVWPVCEMAEDDTLGHALRLASGTDSDNANYQVVLFQRGDASTYEDYIGQSESDLKSAYGVISPRKVKITVDGATVTAVRCDIQAYYAVLATVEYDSGDVIYVSGLTKLASISDIVNLVESVSLS